MENCLSYLVHKTVSSILLGTLLVQRKVKLEVFACVLQERRVARGRERGICNPAWIWQHFFDHLRCSINISVFCIAQNTSLELEVAPKYTELVIPPGTDRTWYRALEVREMEKSGPMHLIKSTKDRKKKKKCYYNWFTLILRFSSHFVCLFGFCTLLYILLLGSISFMQRNYNVTQIFKEKKKKILLWVLLRNCNLKELFTFHLLRNHLLWRCINPAKVTGRFCS